MTQRLATGSEGLDFGAGPGPTLSGMLQERGFRMRTYDPFFAPDVDALERRYDFITCTETAEHFFNPAREFELLDRLLRPGGLLGVMTGMVQDGRSLRSWRYARDPTHVALYRPETMLWVGSRFGWTVDFPDRDVVLFWKRPATENHP
jgi:hypothetical protein